MRNIRAPQSQSSVVRVSIDEVKALMAKKQVVLVDVRDKVSFGEGHMPGAINIVFDDIPNYIERLEKLQKDGRQIVTYCA
jgi:rhodanese-related sulfurtransferase